MNAVLKRMFPNHPHIFKFIDRLRLHEFSKTLDMMDSVKSDNLTNRILKRRKSHISKRDEKIRSCTKAIKENKDMTAGMFLELMITKEKSLENGGNFNLKSNLKLAIDVLRLN